MDLFCEVEQSSSGTGSIGEKLADSEKNLPSGLTVALAEAIEQDYVDTGLSHILSLGVTSIDQLLDLIKVPNISRVRELSSSEKRELIEQVYRWTKKYPQLEAEVVVDDGSQERVARWGETGLSPETIVDIQLFRTSELLEPENEEARKKKQEVVLSGRCAHCGNSVSLDGILEYYSGELNGLFSYVSDEGREVHVPAERENEQSQTWGILFQHDHEGAEKPAAFHLSGSRIE